MTTMESIYTDDWAWLRPGDAHFCVMECRAAIAHQRAENRIRAMHKRDASDEITFGILMGVVEYNSRGIYRRPITSSAQRPR